MTRLAERIIMAVVKYIVTHRIPQPPCHKQGRLGQVGTMLEHPEVKRAEQRGKGEALQIGRCEQCGDAIYDGYEHGVYEDALFCSDSCFHAWIGYEVMS